MRRLFAPTLVALLISRSLVAQETPEAAAEAFGAAIQSENWVGATRLIHPDAVHQFILYFESLAASPGADEVLNPFFGVTSGAELAATPDTVLMARFLQAVMAQANLGEEFKAATIVAIGHLSLGDTALVVSRTVLSINGATLKTFEVMPFVRYRGQYRGLLKADFTNFAEMLKARLGRGS